MSFFSLFTFGLNWIDFLIIIIIGFYAVEGYSIGFFPALIDLLSFVLSFVFGLSYYRIIGDFLTNFFSVPHGFASAIGFFIAAMLFEIVFNVILKILIRNIPIFQKNSPSDESQTRINSFLGIFPGILSGIVLVAFIVSLIISLPLSVFLKHSVSNSIIGNFLVENTQGFANYIGDINSVFGGAVDDTLSFLTVEPKSNSIVELNFKTTSVNIDYASEQKMFSLVNAARASNGVHTLTFSEDLANVGRAHCEDMFARGYFSHYTPEGLSPFVRMAQADIVFNYAGENLALAPNTDLAMQGFMQSTGHRENILSANFNKIGIGVIDGGVYGEMFCQEFTD